MVTTPNGLTLCAAYTATGAVRLTIKRDGAIRTEVWSDAPEALARAAMLAQRSVDAEAEATALARGLFGRTA